MAAKGKGWGMLSSLEGRRLAVLGSMDEFARLVRTAQDRGAYVVVCDGYPEGPAKRIADASYDIDVRDTRAVAEMCRVERVDGVVSSFSDVLAENLVEICEELGFPVYLDSEHMRYLRDKRSMKKMFDELGISYPRSVEVYRESVVADLADLRFPVVAKPVSAYGSHGVRVFESAEEVERRFDEVAAFSDGDCLLCEEYDDGYEFNMMSWIVDGEPVVLEIADREKTKDGEGSIPRVTRIVYPSRFTVETLDEARAIVAKVARYVGMRNGPLCMQFFWSPLRSIRVCECAGRIFGYEHELLEIAGGPTIEDILLDYVYDRDNIACRLAGHSPFLPYRAAGLYFHGKPGIVACIEGIPFEDDPLVVETLSYYALDDTIGADGKPYAMRIFLRADDYARLDEATDTLFGSVRMIDASGRDLLLPNEMVGY